MNSQFSKSILTVALGSICVATTAFAQTAPADFTWYGRIDNGLESQSDGTATRIFLQNYTSRLGIRGEKKIDADLAAIFQIETGVAVDDTSKSKTLASRNSFVGLKSHSFGTLRMGTYDMPLKSLEGTANQLWGNAEAMEVVIHGKGTRAGLATTTFQNFHTRQTNVLHYTSPKFADMVIKAAYSPDEAGNVGQTNYLSKPVYGAAIEYTDDTFNAGFGTETKENAVTVGATTVNMTALKANLGMKMGDFSTGLAISKLDNNVNRKTNNWMLTGTYKMGATTFKANYGASSESADGADDALTMLGLEAGYAFNSAATVYSYYTTINNNTNARGAFAVSDDTLTPAAGKSPKAFGLGMRYNF